MADLKAARDLNEMAGELRRVGGWAPGNYIGKCFDCKRGFMGDKRAAQCLPCAAVRMEARIDELMQSLKPFRELDRPFIDDWPETAQVVLCVEARDIRAVRMALNANTAPLAAEWLESAIRDGQDA